MSAEFIWVAPGDVVTNVTGRVRTPSPGEDGFTVTSYADEGSVGSSEVVFDDEAGTFYPVGLNAYRIYDNESDAADPYLFAGHFGRRREARGVYRTGASRQVFAQVQDANALLSRYVIQEGEDGDRPQETDTARWAWLRATGIFPPGSDFDDSLFIINPAGVTVSAADLTDYTAQQIIDDMAQQSGRNYYVYWDGVNEKYLVVYALDSGTHLTSDLRFSNVLSDVDLSTTFEAGDDWELDISPERLASYVTVRFANGRRSASSAATAAAFSRVDRVMDANLVKTGAVALARATKHINELDTEESELSGTVYLPASKASQFRAGMRVEMKATHLTGLDDFTWVRLTEVSHVQMSQDPDYTYACAFRGIFGDVDTPPIACATALGVITDTVDIYRPITGTPPYGSVPTAAGTGTFLAFSFISIGNNGTFIGDATPLEPTASGWVDSGQLPEPIDVVHTISNVGYRQDAAGDPDWDGGVGTTAADGAVIGLYVQNATLVQKADDVTGLGVIDWGTPLTPGNMVILFRTAEGPTGFSVDPNVGGTPGDWTEIVDVDLPLEAPESKMDVWGICVTEENADELRAGVAGSAWWAHAFEVSF